MVVAYGGKQNNYIFIRLQTATKIFTLCAQLFINKHLHYMFKLILIEARNKFKVFEFEKVLLVLKF